MADDVEDSRLGEFNEVLKILLGGYFAFDLNIRFYRALKSCKLNLVTFNAKCNL